MSSGTYDRQSCNGALGNVEKKKTSRFTSDPKFVVSKLACGLCFHLLDVLFHVMLYFLRLTCDICPLIAPLAPAGKASTIFFARVPGSLSAVQVSHRCGLDGLSLWLECWLAGNSLLD